MPVHNVHYHRCEVCEKTSFGSLITVHLKACPCSDVFYCSDKHACLARRNSRESRLRNENRCYTCEKNLTEDIKKACPCQTVLYCGEECQKSDWKQHKRICNAWKSGEPSVPQIEKTIPLILQRSDSDLFDLAADIISGNLNLDEAVLALEQTAAVFFLEERDVKNLDCMPAGWKDAMPEFVVQISRVETRPIAQEARRRRWREGFLENPDRRHVRQCRYEVGVTVIFEPGGRCATKPIPRMALDLSKEQRRRWDSHGDSTPHPEFLQLMVNRRICRDIGGYSRTEKAS